MKVPMANARTSRSESGFAIIEVVVSAAVLAIVALAVLSGIDGATGSTAREKARAVAASLAEKDQERLRAMSVTTLTNVPQSPTVTVDGVTYTIKSDAAWVNDDTGGTPACGSSSNQSEYFHITSTVTSALVGMKIPPVKIDSLVSPTVTYAQGHGTIGAKVVDRNGAGLPGISVSGTGAAALSTQTTDQNGCVVWRSVLVGSYTININVSGYCDESGASALSRGQNVSPNTVSFVNFTYDRCAGANISVRTHIPGTTFSTTSTKTSATPDVTDVSSNGSLKTWTPAAPATTASTFNVTNLFPYPTTPYGFFTGSCQYESPEKHGLNNYFTNTNSGASLTADATKPPGTVTVFQPPVRIKVSKAYANSQPATDKVKIYFTLVKPTAFAADSCVEPPYVMTIMDYPATGWVPTPAANPTDRLGWASQTSSTFDPGLPFGDYTLCIQDNTVPATPRVYQPGGTYSNKSVDGGPLLTVTATGGTSWPTGTCPT
jgi:type II secretory pathway pseudopilin PulG